MLALTTSAESQFRVGVQTGSSQLGVVGLVHGSGVFLCGVLALGGARGGGNFGINPDAGARLAPSGAARRERLDGGTTQRPLCTLSALHQEQ